MTLPTLYAFTHLKSISQHISVPHRLSISCCGNSATLSFPECNNCWYHFTSHGKLVIAWLGSHRSFSVVLGHWQVKVRHWGLGGPDDWLLPRKAPLAVRRDPCPMPQSNPQAFNSTKRSDPLLHILLFLWDSPPNNAHKDIRCSATSWII